ncbi:hypothetical protein M6B38_376535 [Iris pallida]|uniref:Uncharacterized protein n=1 Tax=Iris pallida TaxID=29817 RepID=A0AAX6G9V5_IRIPA|nr:hypothetical protein M6B38_376530 [Iris pallida]KAJ6825516.1 hypothetical protein M6B38_376535 [Iris pallida]
MHHPDIYLVFISLLGFHLPQLSDWGSDRSKAFGEKSRRGKKDLYKFVFLQGGYLQVKDFNVVVIASVVYIDSGFNLDKLWRSKLEFSVLLENLNELLYLNAKVSIWTGYQSMKIFGFCV